MWSSETPAHRSAAELLLEAGAPPESAAGHLLRVAPGADGRSWSRRCGGRPSVHSPRAAEAAVGYLTRALEEQLDPAARAEVLVELGLGERRTNGPAAADHLRAGLELLADPGRRGEVALELGQRCGSRTGSQMPLPSSSGRSTRSIGSEIRTFTSCWWRS